MTVTYTTEDFVRRTVGSVLRDEHRGGFVCSRCLVRLTLERLHSGWRQSEIELAMEKVFKAPGTINYLLAGPCVRCKRSMPCLGQSPR